MIRVFYLPSLVDPAEFTGRTVVVIDVLRATTTIIWALAQGAREVIPLEEVTETRQRAASLGDHVLLGGERGGIKIDGFDLGNSPGEYGAERVAGKSICFTTTNGTRAMRACRTADTILLGAFANLGALKEALSQSADWDVLCAGTDGQITREDVLLAGALVDAARLRVQNGLHALAGERPPWNSDGGFGGDERVGGMAMWNDQALMAADLWRAATQVSRVTPSQLAALLRDSHGGRNLVEIGQAEDIERAAELDKFPLIAKLDPHSWRVCSA